MTPRKEFDKDADSQPQMRENILNNLSTAVISLDHELVLTYINPAAMNLLDLSEKRGLGQKLTSLIPSTSSIERVLYDSLQTGQPYTQRKAQISLAGDNLITVDFTVTPSTEGDWPRILVEFHPLDRYLRIDRDAALQEHQEVTRQMLRGLAHEIKNPLGGIRGSAQLLEAELDNTLTDYTSIIIDETDRLAGLVDRLLGPRHLPKMSKTNIHEVIEKVRLLIELEDPRIHFVRDYDPSIPELTLDAELMFQALLNIARNGMQSVKDTRHPTITLKTRTERQFTIASIKHRNVLRIDIVDNGPGIPDSLKEHLFYPMISGRPDGSGLGLSVAHSIIYQHRGIIEFDSEAGNTKFTIIVPLEVENNV